MMAGHSIGELAAAYVAGVFSLEDACRLVVARGCLMQELPSGGAMYAIGAPESEVLPLLVDGVAIAAVNGPRSVVISGLDESVAAIAEELRARDVRVKRLATSHAFHSPLMDPMLDAFREVASSIEYHEPTLPMMSDQLSSPEYWVTHVREAVRFYDDVQALRAAGVTRFVEVGPGTALTSMVAEALDESVLSVPLLRKDRPEPTSLVTALARLHAVGVPIDWSAFLAPARPRRVDLPTYAFEHRGYWPTIVLPDAAGTITPADTADAEFWTAVERGDTTALTAALGVAEADIAPLLPAMSAWRRRKGEETARDGWRYRTTWKSVTEASQSKSKSALSGTWLVPTPGAVLDLRAVANGVETLLAAMGHAGAETVLVETVGTGREANAAWLRALMAEHEDIAGVLLPAAWTAGPEDCADGLPAGIATVFAMTQAMGDAGLDAPMWVLTSGAVSIGASDPQRSASAVRRLGPGPRRSPRILRALGRHDRPAGDAGRARRAPRGLGPRRRPGGGRPDRGPVLRPVRPASDSRACHDLPARLRQALADRRHRPGHRRHRRARQPHGALAGRLRGRAPGAHQPARPGCGRCRRPARRARTARRPGHHRRLRPRRSGVLAAAVWTPSGRSARPWSTPPACRSPRSCRR